MQERVDYLEDGKNVFRLRLRLCSSVHPISERIRDFFLEYDRHILRTSPPWGSELLEVWHILYSELESSLEKMCNDSHLATFQWLYRWDVFPSYLIRLSHWLSTLVIKLAWWILTKWEDSSLALFIPKHKGYIRFEISKSKYNSTLGF